MSTTIDQKVVEMQFNNKNFESNVATTMSTLDKFKQSLNLTGATRGLENIDRAAKSVNLSGLSTAVETVGLKFNAMYTIADQALRNITNSAMAAGKKMISALTVDPVKTGLQEYETQMNAVQTIMANTQSKGTTLDDVNKALDELNKYADQTIYNFTEMTRNIGTFTAAGVDLDTSVKSIKGIANLAAVSGSSSQQASTAMYQLSQALAAGKVSLMDWNSVVNAGMGGQVFQDALKRTATVMGTDVDALIKKYGSFRESLTQGEWLTTDVLTKTLEQFTMAAKEGSEQWEKYKKSLMDEGYTAKQAEEILKMANTATDAATKVKTFTQLWDTLKETAQSGWSQTWKIILGDFEEAKSLFTELYKVLSPIIESMSNARNELLQGWKDAGGRDDLFESVFNIFDAIGSVVKPIKEAFADIFPPLTVDKLVGFTEGLRKLTEKLTLSDEASANLKRTFKGLFAILDIVRMAVGSVFDAIKPLLGGVDNLGGGILGLTAKMGDWLVKLRDTIKDTDIFGKIAEKITEILTILGDSFNTIKGDISFLSNTSWSGFKKALWSMLYIVDELCQAFLSIIEVVTGWDLSKAKDNVHNYLYGFKDGLSKLASVLSKAKTSFVEFAKSVKDSFLEKFGDRMKEVGKSVADYLKVLGSAFAELDILKVLKALWSGITKVCSGIASALGTLLGGAIDRLGNANYDGFFDFLNSLLAGGIGVGIFRFVNSVTDSFSSFGDMMENVVDIFDGVRGCFEAFQTQLKAGALMKIATAIAILTAALVVLSMIDSAKLTDAIGAITMLFTNLMVSMSIVDKMGSKVKVFSSVGSSMTSMAIAVLIMAVALKQLSGLDTGDIARGVVGIVALTATLVGAVKLLSNGGKKVMKGALQLVILAAAVKILSSVCRDLSTLKIEEIGKGLLGVAGILLSLGLFTKIAGGSSKMISIATSMVILGGAMKIFNGVIAELGSMPIEQLAKGLISMGLALAIVAVAMTFMPKSTILTGTGLVIVAAGLLVLAEALKSMGSMDWGQVARSLVALAGAMIIISSGMITMIAALPGAIAMVIVSAGILVLAQALKSLSSLSGGQIAKSLIALAGAFFVLSTGLLAMKMAKKGAMALLVASAAIVVFAVALQLMSRLGNFKLGALSVGLILLGTALKTISKVRTTALAIVSACLIVLAGALKLISSMTWGELAKGLIALAGAFALVGIAAILLAPCAPILLALGGAIALIGVGILAAAAGLAAFALALSLFSTSVATGATAIVAAISVIVVGIAGLIPAVIAQIGKGLILLCQVIAEGAPEIAKALKVVILSAVDALVDIVPALMNGVFEILVGVLGAMAQHVPKLVDSMFELLIGVINGLAKHIPDLIQALVNVLMSVFIGVSQALQSIDTGTLLLGVLSIGLLTGILIALGAVVGLIPSAMIGVLGIGAVIAEMALVLAAVGALAQIPGLQWLIGEGGNLLQAVGTAIGQFVGGIVGGFMGGISAQFPQIGSDLSAFMTNVQPFLDGAKSIDPAMMNGVKALAETILILTAANILEGLTSWFAGSSSLASFGDDLGILGTSLNEFASNLGEFDDSKVATVTCAANAVKALAQAADTLPNEGGWAAKIFGENSIATFGSYLPELGTNLASFATNLGSFDESKTTTITCAAEAIKSMAQAASEIPNSGGWAAAILGDNSISTFASKLPELGSNLGTFATNLGTFDDAKLSTVTCAANAIKAMAQAADAIPNEGGWATKILGDNSISTFASKLPELGTNLAAFATNLGTFDNAKVATVDCAANAIKAMAVAAQGIDGQADWAKKLFGDNSLSAFGTEMEKLGSSLSKFAENLGTFGEGKVATVTCAVKAINALSTLADADLKGATKHMGDFGDELGDFATDLESFCTNLPSGDSINAATSNVNKILTMINDISNANADSLANFSKSLKSIGKDGVKSFVEAFTCSEAKTNVKQAAVKMVENAISGAESEKSNVKKEFKSIAEAGVTSLRDKYKSFYNAGSYLVLGFCAGISENAFRAEAKARAMAKAAAKAAEEALDINSPSKVFKAIGTSVPEGFALGIEKIGAVTRAGREMAAAAVSNVKKSISGLAGIIDSEIDTQPTIRPVIDLSNVRSGVGAISSLFGSGMSVGVLTNIGAISGSMSSRGQNGSNAELVSEIRKLHKDLNNISRPSYNINGITYDDGTAVGDAVSSLVRAIKMEGRI